MRTTENFKSSNVDLAAAIITATGIIPDVELPSSSDSDLVEFVFPDTDPVQKAVLRYAAGKLSLPLDQFARKRAWLFRRMRKAIETRKRLPAPERGVSQSW